MIVTLHNYLGRELVRTFLMTLVVLTLLVVMGGGLANIFRSEGLGAEQVARIFTFLTPVAVTLVLPVAALFSAAITYGRTAADNEVLACRAAGINVHRLLLSAFLLGLFVTGATYWAWNYMIPSLTRQIEDLSRRDLPSIVMGQFQRAKPLSFGKYRLMADRCEVLDPQRHALSAQEQHTYLLLTGVSFVELEDQEPSRFGTADATIIDFDRTGSTPRVRVDLQGVYTFDATRRQYYELEHQILGPFEIPLPLKRKIKFENLPTLRRYLETPEIMPAVAQRLRGMRRELMAFVLYQSVEESLVRGDGAVRLVGRDVTYVVSAEQIYVDPEDGRTSIKGVRVEEQRPGGGGNVITADTAAFELRSGLDADRPVIIVELNGNVETRRVPAQPADRVVRKDRESLEPVEFRDQSDLAQRVDAFRAETLLDPGFSVSLPPKQTKMRLRLIDQVRHGVADVRGEIHFRASYAVSAIAVVLFGAILGIIVRGGQVLTAFGISCIPTVFVVVAGIVGRNLADRPDYIMLSIIVMWGATAFIYLVTGLVATRFLRR